MFWSSDVCFFRTVAVRDSVGPLESASYVLVTAVGLWLFAAQLRRRPQAGHGHNHSHDHDGCGHHHLPDPVLLDRQARGGLLGKAGALVLAVGIRPCSGAVLMLLFALAHGAFFAGVAATFAMRSEEHTSELQSLMRISYAVFCLK